jgi:hypothetical protein
MSIFGPFWTHPKSHLHSGGEPPAKLPKADLYRAPDAQEAQLLDDLFRSSWNIILFKTKYYAHIYIHIMLLKDYTCTYNCTLYDNR